MRPVKTQRNNISFGQGFRVSRKRKRKGRKGRMAMKEKGEGGTKMSWEEMRRTKVNEKIESKPNK